MQWDVIESVGEGIRSYPTYSVREPSPLICEVMSGQRREESRYNLDILESGWDGAEVCLDDWPRKRENDSLQIHSSTNPTHFDGEKLCGVQEEEVSKMTFSIWIVHLIRQQNYRRNKWRGRSVGHWVTGSLSHWVKCLLCRPGDLSSNPQHPCKSQVWFVHITPMFVWWGMWLPRTHWPATLSKTANSSYIKRPCSPKK